MRKVQILTDSCSDLTPELMEEFHIDYCKMNTVFEGKTKPADLAWSREDAHQLYETIRSGNRVTTTQVPVEEFDRVFRMYLEKGMDIVYIGCSSKQSGSVGTAFVLAKKLMEEYPGSIVCSVDSLNASMGEGVVAIEAAKYVIAHPDADAKAVEEYTISIRKTIHEYVTVHSLDCLKKAGRVKASSAFFGNLLGVKPILIADAVGNQVALKKVKGRAASIKEIISMLKADLVNAEEQTIYFAHADCSDEEVKMIQEEIRKQIPCKRLYTGIIGPIIGASIGPDAIAIFGLGNQVTIQLGD